MKTVAFTFSTQGEADAFRQGVEYINDSAVSLGETLEYPDNDPNARFVIVATDEDGRED